MLTAYSWSDLTSGLGFDCSGLSPGIGFRIGPRIGPLLGAPVFFIEQDICYALS